MKKIKNVLVLVGITLAVATLAALVKINHLQSGVVSVGKTEVTLKVTVRGTGGRAVRNAVISVFDPTQQVLGKTNDSGIFATTTPMSSGRSLILQAEGTAFKMQRTVLIPRASNYNSTVFFDLAEVHEGHATLVSTANTDSTKLVRISTPRPFRLGFAVVNAEIPRAQKNSVEDLLSRAAIKLGMTYVSKIHCRSWSGLKPIYECELNADGKTPEYRLFSSFPEKNDEAEQWLNVFNQVDNSVPEKKLAKDELMFVIKHRGLQFRAYLGQSPLTFWKERKTERLFRTRVNESNIEDNHLILTIITENEQLLQRKVSWPRQKRVLSVRIPNLEKMDLSKR